MNIQKVTRITPKEAKNYISCEDDQLDFPISFFTLTPSPDPHNKGWEDVVYYTKRPKNIERPIGKINCQWVYVLSNPDFPHLVKIGFTKDKPTTRAKRISQSTGVPMEYEVEYAFPCFNGHNLENEIHRYLETEGFRHNKNREFFKISIEEAISVIERIGEPYKMD